MTPLADANKAEPSASVVRSVEFHPNGQLLLTAGLDKRLRLFQVLNRRSLKCAAPGQFQTQCAPGSLLCLALVTLALSSALHRPSTILQSLNSRKVPGQCYADRIAPGHQRKC